MINKVKVIAFDADDTLWICEPYFQELNAQFLDMMADFIPPQLAAQELHKTVGANIGLYGYGIKPYSLSMIETIIRITGEELSGKYIKKVIALAHEMLARPIELLDGVEQVLQTLQPEYRIAVATKGDLLDQERKIKNSGIAHYFHHIEIMSEKHEDDYSKLIKRLGVQPDEFLMLGNSLKSDIIPVLALGAHAIHIPYYVTWEFERVEGDVSHPNLRTLNSIKEVLPILQRGVITSL